MEDRSRGHARYHRPAVEPPADEPTARAGPDASASVPPPPNLSTIVAAVAVILAAAWIAWLVPLTAVVLVWPILFFVPGWVVIRRVVPDLPLPGAVGAAFVTSVYVSAHLVNVVARVGGFGRWLDRRQRAAAGARLARRDRAPPSMAGAARATRPAPGSSPRSVPTVRPGSSRPRPAWSSSSSWAATAGRRRPTAGSVGGWNWSDLLVHVAIGSSISAGNFPPEVPYFAGVPLTYHWFADFHGAIASTVAGLDIIPVYFASSALFAAVLALVVWALAIRLTGDRRVATIATILVVRRRRAGLDPARRRRHGGRRQPARPGQPASRTTTPGRTAGRSSRSPRSSGPGSCRTGRPRWACRGW